MAFRPSVGSSLFSPIQFDTSFNESNLSEESPGGILEATKRKKSEDNFGKISGQSDFNYENHLERKSNSHSQKINDESICKSLFDDHGSASSEDIFGPEKVTPSPNTSDSTVFPDVNIPKCFTTHSKKSKDFLLGDEPKHPFLQADFPSMAPFVTTRRSHVSIKPVKSVTLRDDRSKSHSFAVSPRHRHRDTKASPKKATPKKVSPNDKKWEAHASSKCVEELCESFKSFEASFLSSLDVKDTIEKSFTSPNESSETGTNIPVSPAREQKEKHKSRPTSLVPPASLNTSSVSLRSQPEGESDLSTSQQQLPVLHRFVEPSGSYSDLASRLLPDQPHQIQTNAIEKLIKDAISEEFDSVRQIQHYYQLSLFKLLDKKMEELSQENEHHTQFMMGVIQQLGEENNKLWDYIVHHKVPEEVVRKKSVPKDSKKGKNTT